MYLVSKTPSNFFKFKNREVLVGKADLREFLGSTRSHDYNKAILDQKNRTDEIYRGRVLLRKG